MRRLFEIDDERAERESHSHLHSEVNFPAIWTAHLVQTGGEVVESFPARDDPVGEEPETPPFRTTVVGDDAGVIEAEVWAAFSREKRISGLVSEHVWFGSHVSWLVWADHTDS